MHVVNRFAGFDRVLESYVEANCSRNFPLLEQATHSRDDVCVMLPNGTAVSGREAVMRAKKQWFMQPHWRMAAHVSWTAQFDDTGIAILDLVYSDADGNGLRWDKRLRQLVVFRKDAGEWKAVAELL